MTIQNIKGTANVRMTKSATRLSARMDSTSEMTKERATGEASMTLHHQRRSIRPRKENKVKKENAGSESAQAAVQSASGDRYGFSTLISFICRRQTNNVLADTLGRRWVWMEDDDNVVGGAAYPSFAAYMLPPDVGILQEYGVYWGSKGYRGFSGPALRPRLRRNHAGLFWHGSRGVILRRIARNITAISVDITTTDSEAKGDLRPAGGTELVGRRAVAARGRWVEGQLIM